MSPRPEELLALVRLSPDTVAEHDKAGWLDLFAHGATVQDPIGTAVNRRGTPSPKGTGEDQLGAFYDTFIAPSEISFTVYQDIVVGNEVIRDVTIHTRLSTGASIDVPTYIRYRTAQENGSLKLDSLEAHWQLLDLSFQVLKQGLLGFQTMLSMSWRMFENQGIQGLLSFSKGMLVGIFKRGPKALDQCSNALNSQDEKGFLSLFHDGESSIEFPAGKKSSVSDFFWGVGRDLHLQFSGMNAAGWHTAGVFHATRAEKTTHGVVFAEFDPKSKRIRNASFYWTEPSEIMPDLNL
jgi:hypothetical protein